MTGAQHAAIARRVLVVEATAGAALLIYGEPLSGIGLTLGGIAGLLVTPDADHHVKTYEEKRFENVPVLGRYLLEVWAGYGAKEEHRGRSHWHIWGTVTRILYFGRRFAADTLLLAYFLVVVVGSGVMDGSLLEALIPYLPRIGFFAFVFLGWTIQDSVHIESDRAWSFWRSKKGKKIKRRIVSTVVYSLLLLVVLVVWYYF